MSNIPTPTPRGRGMNKHFWTLVQDATLIESLTELSQNPMWRTDCGFKNGYLQQLENILEEKLPGCGLKASPHIESRVKWFKQKYCAIKDMLSLSGFGWDNDNMMIVCEKDVFDEFVKRRKDAAGLFKKSFPHYYALSDIYGRDRATGANAGNADDDEEEIRHQDNISDNFGNVPENEPRSEDFIDGMSYTPQSNAPTSSTSRAKKRKGKDKTFDHMCNSIGAMADSVAAMVPKLDGLINVLSTTDKEVADLQGKLYEELMSIEGLNEDQVYEATTRLAKDHDLLRVFFTMGTHLRKGYVLQMLRRGI